MWGSLRGGVNGGLGGVHEDLRPSVGVNGGLEPPMGGVGGVNKGLGPPLGG